VRRIVSVLLAHTLELTEIDNGRVLVLAHQTMAEVRGICI
jgi:hypothetical protein